jgi:hypothetical protein
MKKDDTGSLAVRLTSYGLAAGALALTSGNAAGQVIYSGIQNLVFNTPGILNPLDLDFDGTPDFEVGLAWDSYILNDWSTYSAFIHNPGSLNGWIGDGDVFPLSYSYLVSNGASWTSSVMDYYNLGIASSDNFLGAGNALIGVRFVRYSPSISGHYGWLRVNIDARATEFVVVDWAYEETHIKPIYAGVLPRNLIPPEPFLTADIVGTVHGNFRIGINFSEYIHGFEIGDIQVTGGSVVPGSFFTDDHQHYSALIHPETEGGIIISIPGSIATDDDGNLNMPGANRLYAYYLEVPAVVLTTPVSQPVTAPFQVMVNFSEEVEDLTEADFLVTNGSIYLNSLIQLNPTQYALTIVPENSGYVVIELPSGTVHDADGHNNLTAEPLNILADLNSPQVVLSTDESQPVHTTFTVNLSFNETVEGLHDSELDVTNGFISAGSLSTGNNKDFTVDIIPDQTGELVIQLPAGKAQDVDGFGNLASEPLTVLANISPVTLPAHQNNRVGFYPNPTSGCLIIDISEDLKNSEIRIYNFSGNTIFQSEIKEVKSELDLSHLSSGIYLVQIRKDKTELMHKLVIE